MTMNCRVGTSLLRENLAEADQPPSKTPRPISDQFVRSASAVTPAKKIQLTRIEVYYELSNESKMNSIIIRCP